MSNLSGLNKLSEKMIKMEALVEQYNSSMAANDLSESMVASASLSGYKAERRFTMFADLWVSSERKVGR